MDLFQILILSTALVGVMTLVGLLVVLYRAVVRRDAALDDLVKGQKAAVEHLTTVAKNAELLQRVVAESLPSITKQGVDVGTAVSTRLPGIAESLSGLDGGRRANEARDKQFHEAIQDLALLAKRMHDLGKENQGVFDRRFEQVIGRLSESGPLVDRTEAIRTAVDDLRKDLAEAVKF